MNKIVTIEEYKDLIAKNELTPVDLTKIKSFDEYIYICKDLDKKGILPESAKSILYEYNLHAMKLQEKEEKTEKELQISNDFENDFENIESLNGPTRKLEKSGFIDITIILTMLLNIGFIVAMAMLRK